MSARYVAMPEPGVVAPHGDAEHWYPRSLTITVIDDDRAPQKTGLLDHRGVPIYRLPNKQPCGFGR